MPSKITSRDAIYHDDIKENNTQKTDRVFEDVIVGPDLNSSRTPLDKKNYRHIIIKKNGLRVILISDTLAMSQHQYMHDDEYETDEEDNCVDENMDVFDEVDHDNEDNDDDSQSEEEHDGIRTAAAAMVVGAGSYHDPPQAQGMAHFLEHMLFMGTKKYPKENAYDSFLSRNGGNDNAYTELEYTLYHLEICQEKFFEALDMLSQFFIEPLLLDDAVERELNSIESEFQLSKNSDECRQQQVLCHTHKDMNGSKRQQSIGDHPFGKFSWGNLKSLKEVPKENGIDMMSELRKFFNQHYFAQNMRLVVIGAFSLDELERQVVNKFADIPSLPRVEIEDGPFQPQYTKAWEQKYCSSIVRNHGLPLSKDSLGSIYYIIPVKEKHTLTITWQIPPQWENWKSKPCDYISHLLGHEASGSLLSSLKEKSWVNTCYAGIGDGGHENASTHSLFSLTLILSDKGVLHWEDIVSEVYIYIGMLKDYCKSESGLPQWIYEELKATQEMSYRFEDEMMSVDLVEEIAESVAPHKNLPPEHVLDGESLIFNFDGNLIRELLDDYLQPQNARVDLMSSSFGRAADKTNEVLTPMDDAKVFPLSVGKPNIEPMFGTQFWSFKISLNVMKRWNDVAKAQQPPSGSSIKLPPKNPFVPSRFDLKATSPEDTHHPLLHASLKICLRVGKQKSWFPASVLTYDGTRNKVLLSYEDEEKKWHILDNKILASDALPYNFEGTLDNKTIKFKVVALAKEGDGAILKYGDNSDWHVEDGIHFPPIPPALPKSRLPLLVCNDKLLKIWHLHDLKFKRPTAELRLNIICAKANKTPVQRACADLFAVLCSDALTETCYMASICKLGNSITSTDVGFSLRVHGFDDKLLDLTESILSVFFSFRKNKNDLPDFIKPSRFDACLEIVRRKYGNTGMQSSSLCSDIRLRCIRPSIFSAQSKLDSLVNLRLEVFTHIIQDLLDEISIQMLHHGNIDRKSTQLAENVVRKASNGIKMIAKNKYPSQRVLVIPQQKIKPVIVPTIDTSEPNTAVEFYIQVGKDEVRHRVLIDLLVQLLYEPLYDQLRTKEQFGYHVSCGARWTNGVMGMCFNVVTSCKSADDVTKRLKRFLIDFKEEISSISDEMLLENLVGLAKNKLQKYNSLEEECINIWSEIIENRYDWEVYRNEAIALRAVTKPQLMSFYDKWIVEQIKNDRVLVVHAIGSSEGAASAGKPSTFGNTGRQIDAVVSDFHKVAHNKHWGKIF
mmetsp:Transcript_4670/g.6622  ORF Transcript_4670/g.6622 Transcript_4670/m.6622 type:complete len:1236 (+) Transcript_4670:57-3764(+)